MPKLSIKKYIDPYFDNVSLLLPFNGNFNDNSKNNFPVSPIGNAQISSVQSKFGGSSLYLPGYSPNYATTQYNVNWSNDIYTIEAWIYVSSMLGSTPNAIIGNSTTSNDGTCIYILYDGRLALGAVGLNQVSTSPGTINLNTWHHIAVVKMVAGNPDLTTQTTKIFVDGIEKTLTSTGSGSLWVTASNQLNIGYIHFYNGYPFNGYVDELRITKGIARYTSIFNPNPNGKLNIKKVEESTRVSSVSGLALWLKADAGVMLGGGNISGWRDQSSNGNDAVGPSQKRPTYINNGINGQPAILFNGSTQHFIIADSNSLDITNGSIYMVVQRTGEGLGNNALFLKSGDNMGDSNYIYGINPWHNGINLQYLRYQASWNQAFFGTSFGIVTNSPFYTGLSDNNPHIIGFRFGADRSIAHQDQYLSPTSDGATIINSNGPLYLGGIPNRQGNFAGKISEVIIFNKYLSDTEHSSLEYYLNNKYNIYTYSSSFNLLNGKLKIKTPEPLPLNEIFLRLESDKNITLNGSNVSAWGDLSGGTRNFSQATTNNQPIFFNGGLKFEASQQYNDGNADYMENTNNPSDINNITGPYTFAVVANLNLGLSTFINASSNNSYRRKLSCYYYNSGGTNSLGIDNGPGDGYASSISNPPLNIGQKNIIIIRAVSNTEVDYFINNNAKISQNDANLNLNPGITTPTPLYLGIARGFGGGGYNAEASWGNPVIYDLFLYNKSLTDSEVVALKYYLNNKHAIY